MRKRRNPPDGLVTERTLRSFIRTLAVKLKNKNLSVAESMALLKQQERLSEQLRESAAARLESELADKKSS